MPATSNKLKYTAKFSGGNSVKTASQSTVGIAYVSAQYCSGKLKCVSILLPGHFKWLMLEAQA